MICSEQYQCIGSALPFLKRAEPQRVREFQQAGSLVRILAGVALIAWGYSAWLEWQKL